MSLLDDARALAAEDVREEGCRCFFCGLRIAPEAGGCFYGALHRHRGHDDDCPWLAMPRIVAALEAAERLTDDAECWAGQHGGNMPREVEWLQVRQDAYEALQAALRDEAPAA